MTSTATPTGERFLHLLNLDGFPKTLRLFEHGRPLLDGRPLTLQARDGVMLPLGVRFQEFTVVQGTAEIRGVGPGVLELRLTQPEDWIELESATEPAPSADYRVERAGRGFRVVSRKDARVDDRLRVRWERS
ncbi:hypothetical protein [Candidatus Methylocalor cossyra]|uniref:hypothetical protein n=1 Tax=Candidatus Methylocalor cossyra TaxID=3108543 RepID=UPI0032B0F2EF